MEIEFLRFIHWASILFFFTFSSIVLWYGGGTRFLNISVGIFTLGILVTGLLLAKKVGIAFWGEWTWWIKWKIVIWLFLAMIVPVVARRAPKLGKITYFAMMFCALVIFKILIYRR